MKICTRCLYSEIHPLGITFDINGVCSGCLVHEEKDNLNWSERFDILKRLVSRYRSKNNNTFDCIVPISGARDSYFILYVVTKLLGLKPLLVSYNNQYNTEIGIRNLAYLRIAFDCDLVQITVNPNTIRKINLTTMEKFGSIYWHIQAGKTAYPVQTAIRYQIPLIIWGVHQGIDQVGMFSHLEEVEMTRRYRKDHDLMDNEIEDLLNYNNKLIEENLDTFIYPDDKELSQNGIRGIYLNNYIRWDTKTQHELMIKKFHYETSTQYRTFDNYNTIDCHYYSGLHDKIKMVKWGFGQVVDNASREIRLGRLSREQALSLVKYYQEIDSSDEELFLKWQGMSKKYFWELINKHRNTKLWKFEDNNWQLNHPVYNNFRGKALKNIKQCYFKIFKKKKNLVENQNQLLIGKGYIPKRNEPNKW